MLRSKFAISCVVGVFTLTALVACGGDAAEHQFVEMGGIGNYALIAPEMSADELVLVSREKCGQKNMCSIFAWSNETDIARAFPMTDREVEAQIFTYKVNRNTGFDQRLWNCSLYKEKSGDDCL